MQTNGFDVAVKFIVSKAITIYVNYRREFVLIHRIRTKFPPVSYRVLRRGKKLKASRKLLPLTERIPIRYLLND